MKRCFIGMRVDREARERLADILVGIGRLPSSAARRVKPIPPENLHATIKFLGPTADRQVSDLTEALAEVLRLLEPEPVEVEGFGAFPSPSRPRIIFARLGAGADLVNKLAVAVEDAVEPLGYQREERPHVPHISIARIDQPRPHGPLSDWLAAAPAGRLGAVVATHLVLFESKLGGDHARYTALAELPLGG